MRVSAVSDSNPASRTPPGPPDEPAPAPEFDAYAARYAELLRDPIRDIFSPDSRFFAERKWVLIRDFFRRAGISTRDKYWLDVGCGRGDLLDLGGREFAGATGCDPSCRMLDACRGWPVRTQASADSLPFPGKTFDLVTAICVYHHVDPAGRAALTAEVARVLRPGGLACLIEHNPFNPATRLIVSRTPVDADARLLYARSACRLLRSAGLEPVNTRYFLWLPPQLYRRLRPLEDLVGWIPLGGQYAAFARKA